MIVVYVELKQWTRLRNKLWSNLWMQRYMYSV